MAFRSLGVVVSTSPSHGGDTGSNPVGSAILSRPLIALRDFFERGDEARVGDRTSITRADPVVLRLGKMFRAQLTGIDEIPCRPKDYQQWGSRTGLILYVRYMLYVERRFPC